MEKNKVTTYLLYAIGEIVLVVIGILIAVSLNNWNNQKKLDRRAETLLIQIQEEALLAIEHVDVMVGAYQSFDSTYQVIISDTLTREDYMKTENWQIRNFASFFVPMTIQKEGFKSFVNQADQFSPVYQALSQNLKATYLGYDFYTTKDEESFLSILNARSTFLKSQPWYVSYDSNELPSEFIDYLMNDYRYKNLALDYHRATRGTTRTYLGFQKSLVDLYLQINSAFKEPPATPPIIANYYTKLATSDKEQLAGTYRQPDGSTLEISIKDDQLFLNDDPIDAIRQDKLISLHENGWARYYTYDLDNRIVCMKLLYAAACYTKE